MSTYDVGFRVELSDNSSTQNFIFLWEALIVALLHNPWNSAGPKPQPLTCVFSLGSQNSFLILIRYKLWLLYYPAVPKTFPAYAPKENLAEKIQSKKNKVYKWFLGMSFLWQSLAE